MEASEAMQAPKARQTCYVLALCSCSPLTPALAMLSPALPHPAFLMLRLSSLVLKASRAEVCSLRQISVCAWLALRALPHRSYLEVKRALPHQQMIEAATGIYANKLNERRTHLSTIKQALQDAYLMLKLRAGTPPPACSASASAA
eukprot:764995-Pelagomonas_calceolata.AAC.6